MLRHVIHPICGRAMAPIELHEVTDEFGNSKVVDFDSSTPLPSPETTKLINVIESGQIPKKVNTRIKRRGIQQLQQTMDEIDSSETNIQTNTQTNKE